MARFKGRQILVTGAAGGLGSELCIRLVSEGAHVIGTDLSEERLAVLRSAMPKGRGRLTPVVLDQSDPESARNAVAEMISTHGTCDSLVNNAGIYPKSLAECQPLDEMKKVMDVNAISAAAFLNSVVPGMKEAGFGRVINVSSITFTIGFVELSAYVASKGALVGLARVWARELGPYGITVNYISPGAFQTDAEKIHSDPDGYNQFVINQQAVKRRGVPADFAHAAMFLLDRESGFITGQNLTVDGGWVMQ